MTGAPVSFSDYRVDPSARELWKGDRLVDLPPHVFDFLCHLIKHRDRAVGRDELVAAVWGKTEVSDTLIGQTVMRIRRELGDDGKDQRILRTIPRFGYRWVADVHSESDQLSAMTNQGGTSDVVAERDPAAAFANQPAEIPAAKIRRHPLSSAVWLLLPVLLLALAVLLIPTHSPPKNGLTEKSTIGLTAAVLLADLDKSVNPEESWLRFGVMDAVSGRLRSSGLPAMPSESVIALQGSAAGQGPERLRKAANVTLLVVPSVSAVGANWQVRLDADDGERLHVSVDAHSSDAMQAARLAADKLLAVLGQEVPNGQVEVEPLGQLIQRIDAAVLADDPDTAKSLIRQAPVAQRNSPEVGLRLAKIDFRTGRGEEALERLRSLLERTPAETQPELRAGILNGLGAVAIRADDPFKASGYFNEAVTLLESRDDPAALGEAYLGRAVAAAEQGKLDLAMSDYALARVTLREANDTLALLRVDANEGFLELERGMPAQALPRLRSASQGFEQWGALNETIFAQLGEIEAHLALLQTSEALETVVAAERLAQRVEGRTTLVSLALTKGRALAAAGQWSEARKTLHELRDASPPLSSTTEAMVSGQLAEILLGEGKPQEALRQLDNVADQLALPRQTEQRADVYWAKLSALVQLGDMVAAASELATFESWAVTVDNRHVQMLAQLARARFDWRFGPGDSRASFAKAVQLAEASGIPADIAMAGGAYADVLLVEGDLELASTQIGRLSRWSDKDYQCAVLEARLYAALGKDEARQAALARARSLAGERVLPADATHKPISTREASTQ